MFSYSRGRNRPQEPDFDSVPGGQRFALLGGRSRRIGADRPPGPAAPWTARPLRPGRVDRGGQAVDGTPPTACPRPDHTLPTAPRAAAGAASALASGLNNNNPDIKGMNAGAGAFESGGGSAKRKVLRGLEGEVTTNATASSLPRHRNLRSSRKIFDFARWERVYSPFSKPARRAQGCARPPPTRHQPRRAAARRRLTTEAGTRPKSATERPGAAPAASRAGAPDPTPRLGGHHRYRAPPI